MNIFSNGINYADGETPTVMTANIEALGYEGWYYKNSGLGKKITWYIPLGDSPLLVSDLTMVYTSLRLLNTASLPFLIVYTAPIGINDADTWYHSKTVFSVPETVDLNENTNYCFYAEIGTEVSEILIDGHTNIKLTTDSSGDYTSTNVIKYIAFCTAEDAAAGEVEFILSDINLLKPSGDVELFLSNDELFSSIKVDINALVLSSTDVREPGTTLEYAFLNPLSVTKVVKTENSSLRIGHNSLINDTILNNFKLPRLANVAGKGDSSIAVDNINTLFNNFYLSLDFAVETNVPSAQFSVEAWGLDCTTRTKVFVDKNGDIKIMYRGVDLFSKNKVLPGDIILDASSNPTEYGWTTHVFPGSLIPGNWYRLVQTIHFSDELYEDQVLTQLYELSAEDGNVIDIVLWDVVDNTWEAFYVNHPSQAINGNMSPSVDSIQIHCSDAPRNLDIATIKNITYSTSKTIRVASIDELMPSSKGIVTFLSGNSTGKSIDAITGLQYLFEASGGYQMERGFNKITARTQDLIQRFDVTDSVQVKLSAGLFNTKLGLVKDASNQNIITTTYNSTSGGFPTDSITITSSDFVYGISANNIISVGKYSTMYSDFISYVRKYFGYSGGFSSLFKAASEFDISGGVFNADSFVSLLSSGTQIVADDVNAVNTAPSLYYKLTDVSGSTYIYENVAKAYTNTFINQYGIRFIDTITKWGAGTLYGNNSVAAVTSSKYIVPGITGMSFSFWVNILNNQWSQNKMLFSLGNVFNVAVRNSYYIVPFIECTNGGFSTTINYLNGFLVGTWNYITITVDPAGIWKYYLNGAFKQSVSIASGNAFGYPSTTTALNLQFGMALGYYNEFLYYERILSATEIKNLYSMYTVNNGATISSWVKFSSLDTTPRTLWSFYDTISKKTLSFTAKNTNYTLNLSGMNNLLIGDPNFAPNASPYTVSGLTYPNHSINGTYIYSASFLDAFQPYSGAVRGGSWRTPWYVTTGYTQVPYNGNYIGGGSTKFFTTQIDNLTISGEWWQIQLPSSMYITRYGMNPHMQRQAWPRAWYIAGSNDGTTWTQLDRITNQNQYVYEYNNIVWYNLPNPGSYNYLRIIITNTQVGYNHSWIANFSIGVDTNVSLSTNIDVVPTINTWTHIATTFDNGQKNNIWTTYINKIPYYSDIDSNSNKLPYINLSNSVNAIGMDASSGLNKMHGYVDDVVIYKSVLSPAKIEYLYNGSDTLGKVADYTFDTNSQINYSLANYASGSAVYDASITNLSLMTDLGEKFGSGCLYFPNKTYPGSIKLGKMTFLDQHEFSFSTWANFSSLDNSGSVSTILSMYSANSYILLSATASKYTLAIKNTQAPVFVEALPVENNDFTTSSQNISGLGYPYCRNGVYISSGTVVDNHKYNLLNRGTTINNSNSNYSTLNGSYIGNVYSYVNSIPDPSNIPYGTNAITGGGYGISGDYVQYQLPYKLNPTYFLTNAWSDMKRMHKTFYILGSNDNSVWEILLYKTNVSSIEETVFYSGRNFSYNISSSNYYNYFRIVCAQTNNLDRAYFHNFRLNGYALESINYTMNCNIEPVVDDWNHIAGTLSNNGFNSTVKMYINNSPYTFTTDSSGILFPAFGVDVSYTNIAVGMDASGELNKMVGYIDDTKFYNASLSDAQINSLYYNQSIFETALGKYNFNTETVVGGQIANYASGTPVYDSTITNTSLVSSTGQRSGSGALFFPSTSYTGSVHLGNFTYDTNTISVARNGAVWNYKFDVSQNAGGYIYDTTSGNYNMNNTYVNTLNSISSVQTAVTGGKSLNSNAGTTAVYYGGNPIYTIPMDAAMTFAFWIYIDSNVSNNGKGVIGMANSDGTSVISVKISGTTTYNLSLQTIFNGTTTTNITSETITPATWTYVCWNISTTGVWKFYVNGVLKQTINANVKPFFSATNLFAASAYGAAGFYGYLDEYRYYERELTAAEISSQYNYYTISPSATIINDLSGSITISNINNLLRNAVDANVFGNRTPSYNSSYGVGDGFLDGDIIWVPEGTTIKLSVGIDSESFLPINNVGPATSADVMVAQDTSFGTGNFSQATSASVTKISRTLKAPLMIRVSNL